MANVSYNMGIKLLMGYTPGSIEDRRLRKGHRHFSSAYESFARISNSLLPLLFQHRCFTAHALRLVLHAPASQFVSGKDMHFILRFLHDNLSPPNLDSSFKYADLVSASHEDVQAVGN